MKKICVSIFDDVAIELELQKSNNGANKTWIVNEALKLFLGMKQNDRLYINLPQDVLGVLRQKCIESQLTMNEAANEYIKKGIENEGTKQ